MSAFLHSTRKGYDEHHPNWRWQVLGEPVKVTAFSLIHLGTLGYLWAHAGLRECSCEDGVNLKKQIGHK
jgi:hypothetical protein